MQWRWTLWMWMFISTFSVATNAWAAVPVGIWKFDRSADYFGRMPANEAPQFSTIIFRDNEVRLSETCTAKVKLQDYSFSQLFQPLTKQGISARQVDSFLMKHFKLSLSGTNAVYRLKSTPTDCDDPMGDFFVIGDRILFVAGASFYSYVKI